MKTDYLPLIFFMMLLKDKIILFQNYPELLMASVTIVTVVHDIYHNDAK